MPIIGVAIDEIVWLLYGSQTKNTMAVRLGEYNLEENDEQEVDYDVVAIKIHENYGRNALGNLFNDIALIYLEGNAWLSSFIQPICLPESNLRHNTQIM